MKTLDPVKIESATARPWKQHGFAIYAVERWQDGNDLGSQFVAQVQDDDDIDGGFDEAGANAALIVQAVNERAALLAVAEAAEAMTRTWQWQGGVTYKATDTQALIDALAALRNQGTK